MASTNYQHALLERKDKLPNIRWDGDIHGIYKFVSLRPLLYYVFDEQTDLI